MDISFPVNRVDGGKIKGWDLSFMEELAEILFRPARDEESQSNPDRWIIFLKGCRKDLDDFSNNNIILTLVEGIDDDN